MRRIELDPPGREYLGGGETPVQASLRTMRESGSGTLTLVIWQLDASGTPITNLTMSITSGTSWSLSDLSGALAPGAATLRYEIYRHGDATFCVDDLNLTIQ